MKVSTSILNANFIIIKEELISIFPTDFIHLDIMDGNFVKKISFGDEVTKCIASLSIKPLDIHLMVSNTKEQIDLFSDPIIIKRTKFITLHYESISDNVENMINYAKRKFPKVGLSIKPGTPVETIVPYLNMLDLVLVMTVEPGLGGQSILPETVEKVNELLAIRQEKNYDFVIEIDGGINLETIKLFHDVDIAVIGSAIFKLPKYQRRKYYEAIQTEAK